MAVIKPFRAYRPVDGLVKYIAAPPYDVVNSEEAKEIVKSYHPKIESFVNVRKGALVNSYDYPYYYQKNIEEDDVEFEDAKDKKEEEKEGETTIKEYIKLELNPEFVEESGDLVTVQFASEEDGERAYLHAG